MNKKRLKAKKKLNSFLLKVMRRNESAELETIQSEREKRRREKEKDEERIEAA